MSVAKAAGTKRNLLLCFDAFGTLFTPSVPIPSAYAVAATRHGIQCGDPKNPQMVATRFKRAFKEQSNSNPNYGKATGLGAEKWWGNVIRKTFEEFLQPGQQVPQALVTDLLERYSTRDGYNLYHDVKPFFDMLKENAAHKPDNKTAWRWSKTVVGIVTNSDDRVPGILESFGLKIGPRRIGTPDQRTAQVCLEDDISFVVLSYDVGVEKPDRQMFDAAIEMLQETLVGNDEGLSLDKFEKLYVGDEVEKDYEGARAAGWDSVLLRRECKASDTATAKTYRLEKREVLGKDGSPRSVLVAEDLSALRLWRPSAPSE